MASHEASGNKAQGIAVPPAAAAAAAAAVASRE